MQQKDAKDLPTGDIEFFDSVIPQLKDGDYTITASPTLTGVDGANVQTKTQYFSVQGARFKLDPTNDVQFMFPPDKSSAQFEQKLPHIVLTKRSLPWERFLGPDPATPWVALLVFDEDQIISPPKSADQNSSSQTGPTKSRTLPVKEVCNLNAGGILGPAIKNLDYGQTDDTMCQAIDISVDTFRDIMPLLEELPYLAHVREVNVGHKTIMNMKHSGWFSVVVSNRFPIKNPSKPTKQICHLVSLEGFEKYLVASPSFPKGVTTIRLISLISWSFTCLSEPGETFSELARNLVSEGSEAGTELLFKMSQAPKPSKPTPEQALAYNAIDCGFIPMSYKTRSSDQTFAWYRGPFSPVLSERFTMTEEGTIPPFESSGQAVIYDQNTGLFNLSYAVAWETGRMLALADKTFGVNLLNWRREANYLVDLLVTRLTDDHLSSLIDRDSQDMNDWLQNQFISEAYLSYLLGDFSKKIAPRIPSAHSPSQSNANTPDDPIPDPNFTPPSTPTDLAAEIKKFLDQEDAKAVLHKMGTKQLTAIIEWLSRLYLLYGVPTNTLIPNNQEKLSDASIPYRQILPRESIRFFYLDRAWLDSLIDGAMSIGIHNSRDSIYYKLTKDMILDGVETLILEMREKQLGLPISSKDSTSGNISGFLLRSQLVQNWPGLEVKAYKTLSSKTPDMKALRMDRLSPTLLLCLFPDMPAKISLAEPSEGLCFGVELGDATNNEQIYLRDIQDGSTKGSPYTVQTTDYRPNSNSRVFNIMELKENLAKACKKALSPADFALQMIDVPQQMVFQNEVT